MAVPHHAVAAVGQLQVLPLGDEGVGFGNQHLRQHSPSAFTCDFGQWIIDCFRLTERDDGGISRHGVSLLSGGSGRLDTRLDTPPSTKRRHPDSGIALREFLGLLMTSLDYNVEAFSSAADFLASTRLTEAPSTRCGDRVRIRLTELQQVATERLAGEP